MNPQRRRGQLVLKRQACSSDLLWSVHLQRRHFLFLPPRAPTLIGASHSLSPRRAYIGFAHTQARQLEDPRARPVVLFSPRSVSLQRRRQDLGSFHVARGRETALCEHPLCRHLTFLHHQYLRPLLLLSFIVLTSRHHCYPPQTLAVGWIVSQG